MKKNDVTINEWLLKANNDLGSAKVLISDTNYFDIVVYHSHQAVEKLLKWYLLKNNKQFPFIHDLVRLLVICEEIKNFEIIRCQIDLLNALLPRTRYPYGDSITQNEAAESINTANKVFDLITIEGELA